MHSQQHFQLTRTKRKHAFEACANIEGPDQTRAFAVREQNHWILQTVSMENKGPDETLRMRSMIWICVCMFEDIFSHDMAQIWADPAFIFKEWNKITKVKWRN